MARARNPVLDLAAELEGKVAAVAASVDAVAEQEAAPPPETAPEGCGTCRYCRKGQCRVNPPSVFLSGTVGPQYVGAWPAVKGDDWCARWEGV